MESVGARRSVQERVQFWLWTLGRGAGPPAAAPRLPHRVPRGPRHPCGQQQPRPLATDSQAQPVYLRQLPVRESKLDRSYTADLLTSGRTSVIVRSTIELAHALGLRVVAEGVEDEPTFARLAALGCDVVQGYWLAQPMPAPEVTAWLNRMSRPLLRTAR